MITIREISDKKIWEDFVLSQPNNSFFQSWDWGEVQEALRYKIWRLGISDKNKLVGAAQVVKVTARRGRFLHLRHGPILGKWQAKYLDPLVEEIKKIGNQENVWFIRISPLIEKSEKNQQFFQQRGFRPAPIHGQDAELAWVLDITRSEDEILAGMRKTTRYLVRKAQKLGVEVIEGQTEQDLDVFLRLYQKTAQRQDFVPHQGLEEEWKILGRENLVRLYLAKYQEIVLAGALIIFYGDQVVYHHSGADRLSDIPATYALLWEAIQKAKKEGKSIFNFWGIAPFDKPHHPWKGLTLFKTGFGGETKEYIHAQDLPLSPFYWLTWLVESTRRIKKGY